VGRDASTPVTVRMEKVVSVALDASDISLMLCTMPLGPSSLGRLSCSVVVCGCVVGGGG